MANFEDTENCVCIVGEVTEDFETEKCWEFWTVV